MADRLAVYTTVYPAALPFLTDWRDSLAAQTDQGFDLWIGVDGMSIDAVAGVWPDGDRVTYVPAGAGESPAELRSRSWTKLVECYDGIIMIDSDDLAEPERVAAARVALVDSDVAGCALRLIDAAGADLGHVLAPPAGVDAVDALPRQNVFGLSNTVFRSSTLRGCLPVPAECRLIDWLLVTRAWARGAKLTFDRTARMRYRQHDRNTTRLVGPFTAADVLSATALVRAHHRFALASPAVVGTRAAPRLLQAREAVDRFYHAVSASNDLMEAYLNGLNQTPAAPMWWWCVAHPALEHIWSH